MKEIELLIDLAFALGAALVGGFIAHRLRQPVILGYLLAGVVIGPYSPGPVANLERVQTLANLGVTLLMFALGVKFSLEALQRVRLVAVYGGVLQIALCGALGTALGLAIGYSLTASIFLGGIISISSSILLLKLLLSRDEVDSITGRVALGIVIVQDLAVVPLIIILPALSGGVGLELLLSVGLALLKGGGFLVASYLLGTRLVPPALARLAQAGSRELFLLTVVGIAASMAALGQVMGISFALGAFLAGLIVSESEFSTQVAEEIAPVRDIFATLFFVSIGMLMDPAYLLSHAVELALLVAAIIVGKLLICAGVIRLFGYPGAYALRGGLLLAQIGEFSFVLAGVGLGGGVIDENLYNLVLAGALVSLVLNPLLVNSGDRVLGPLEKLFDRVGGLLPGAVRRWVLPNVRVEVEEQSVTGLLSSLKRHVIVCGYGRVGMEIARALQRRGFSFVVIDFTTERVEQSRKEGHICIEGDATHPSVLERAGLSTAKMLAVTLPDLPSAEQVVRVGRLVNPKVNILARTSDARAIHHLKAAGADEVVQPEFETGLEMVRQALRSYGVSSLETQSIMGGRREEHYRGARNSDLSEDSGRP